MPRLDQYALLSLFLPLDENTSATFTLGIRALPLQLLPKLLLDFALVGEGVEEV